MGSSNAVESGADTIHAQLSQQVVGNHTELAIVAYSASCYGYTGDTCLTSECGAERNASCVDAKCSCVGKCSGADGVCASGDNKKVNTEPFSLSNKKWPSQWLFMQTVSVLSQLKTSSQPAFMFSGQQKFDLYQLPGLVKGKKQYFLNSNKWPDWVAAIRSTGSVLSGSVSLFGLFGESLTPTAGIAPWNPQGIAVQVCSMKTNGYSTEVMIGSSGSVGRTEWAYVHHASWF